MSQQTLFAVCLLVGLVAMVSGQSMDFQGCSKSVRARVDKYRESMMQAGQKFSNDMQQTAGQAMDTSAIQSDIDKMTQSVASLTDMSNGFDMGRLTSVYLENLQTLASIGRKSMRPSLITGGLGNYMDFLNTLMSTNTQFMQDVTEACMPSTRRL